MYSAFSLWIFQAGTYQGWIFLTAIPAFNLPQISLVPCIRQKTSHLLDPMRSGEIGFMIDSQKRRTDPNVSEDVISDFIESCETHLNPV